MSSRSDNSFVSGALASAGALLAGLVLIGGLTGCSQRLPKDPAARIAEIRRRMEAAVTSNQKSSWLVHAADNPTTAARDLLLENLEAPHLILSAAAADLLRVRWVKDPETRRRIRAYYLDPTRSFRNRQTLYSFLIDRYKKKYPEFADLPKTPPTLTGRVHIEKAEPKGEDNPKTNAPPPAPAEPAEGKDGGSLSLGDPAAFDSGAVASPLPLHSREGIS